MRQTCEFSWNVENRLKILVLKAGRDTLFVLQKKRGTSSGGVGVSPTDNAAQHSPVIGRTPKNSPNT
jgi:hypothetical protein